MYIYLVSFRYSSAGIHPSRGMPAICKKTDLPFVEPPTRLLRQFSDSSLYFVRLVDKIGRNNVKNRRVLVVTYDHLILAYQDGRFARYASNDQVAGIRRKKVSGKGDKGDGFVWQILLRIPKEFDILCNFVVDQNNDPMNEFRTAKHFIEVMTRIHFSKFPDSTRAFDLEVAETDDLFKQGNFDRHEGYQSPMELLHKKTQVKGKQSPSFSTSPTSPRGSASGKRQLRINTSPEHDDSFYGGHSPVSGFGTHESSLGRTSPPIFRQQLKQQQQQQPGSMESYRKKQEEWIENIEGENVNLKYKVLQFKNNKESSDKKITDLQEQVSQLAGALKREQEERERDHVEMIQLKLLHSQYQNQQPSRRSRDKITVDTQLVNTDSDTDEIGAKSLRSSLKKKSTKSFSDDEEESCDRKKTLPLRTAEQKRELKNSGKEKKKKTASQKLLSPTPPEESLSPPIRVEAVDSLPQVLLERLEAEGVSQSHINQLVEIGISSSADIAYATYNDLSNVYHHVTILKIIKAFGYKLGATPDEVLVKENSPAPVGITPQLGLVNIQLTDSSPDGTGILTENANLRNMVAYLQNSISYLNAVDNTLASPAASPPKSAVAEDNHSENLHPDLVGCISDWPHDLPNYDAFLAKPDYKAFAVACDPTISPSRKRPWGASWTQHNIEDAINEAKTICLQKCSQCVVVFPTSVPQPYGSNEGAGLHSI